MKLLAIETSGQACSVALLRENEIISHFELAPMRQAQIILSIIKDLLAKSNVQLKELDALAFGCGPGSFTGVRLATSIVQGIGFGLNIPVIPISSLATLAQTAHQEFGWKKLLVAVDARMQEVYWAQYEIKDGLVQLIQNEKVISPSKLVFPKDSDWYGIGSGWGIYREQMNYQPLDIQSELHARAEHLLLLARQKFLSEDWMNAGEVRPSYVRNKVADKKS